MQSSIEHLFPQNKKGQGVDYTCRLYASASTFVQLAHTAFSSGYGGGGDDLELHIEASSSTCKGKEGKKKQVNKESGRETQKNSGVTGRPLRDGQCRHQKGSVFPLSGSPSLQTAVHPTSAGNPHTSAYQKELIFPFGNQIRKPHTRSGSFYA